MAAVLGMSASGIETISVTRKRVIVMPRWGVKNIVVKDITITMPRIRFLERGDPPEEARADGERRK